MIVNTFNTSFNEYYTGHVITASSLELPIAIEDARAQLRMDDLRHDDEYLMLLIKAQCDLVERTYQAALLTKTVIEYHKQLPTNELRPMIVSGIGPVQSVTSVQYYNTDGVLTTWASSEYDVRITSGGATIQPKADYTYPSDFAIRTDSVVITYTAGYGDTAASIPPTVRLGILSRIGRAYTNREDSAEQVMSMSDVLLQPLRRWI